MTDDEWIRVVQAIASRASRKRVALTGIPDLLSSYGIVDETDTQGQRESVAALMRHILNDVEIQELVRLTVESKQLTSVGDLLLVGKIKPSIANPEFWTQYHEKRDRITARIKELRKIAYQKVALLDSLAKTLKALGSTEEFDLPTIETPFPPL